VVWLHVRIWRPSHTIEKEMSWFPVLDLAAQYWQGTRTLPRDYDVLDRLRKAISDMPAEDSQMGLEETPSQEAAETGGESPTWSSEEDCKLQELARTHQCGWEEVALHLPRHSAIACRERWELEHPSQAAFQPHEDSLLVALHSKLGPNWTAISDRLPGRSPHSLEQRLLLLSPTTQHSQSTLTASAEDSLAKEQQIQLLRRNAGRLEEKIRRYKEELGSLERDLDASQF